MKKLLLIVVSAIALSGCVISNQEGGAVVGGVTGAVVGNHFGSGKGKTAATALGAVIGALSGSAVGRSMDRPRTVIHRNAFPSHRRHHSHSRRHSHSRYERQCLYVPHRYVDFHGHYHDYSRIECRMIRRGPHFP